MAFKGIARRLFDLPVAELLPAERVGGSADDHGTCVDLLPYNVLSYYERLGFVPIELDAESEIIILQCAEIPDIPLRKGEANLSPRPGAHLAFDILR